MNYSLFWRLLLQVETFFAGLARCPELLISPFFEEEEEERV